ncbi:Alcohol dehydrogenase GroES-like domain/D-isomer specific 2-hydroxyacid dehydrogenase, NAD binding domain/Alanine dehydrogenase/PNT, C-terminal domain/NAD binding domain of 6-phosphogluconate dehydrogenase/Zinc-binding dehydrogenase, putative [Angomonas deanei]|uniref:Enoyl reductase (ER) domain-containing protein n=1 Tax=Angomonas deanei TaxID=59799 RepID=A0A7G2C0B8_9TRYP|nr:Alcohol dehydrogenase GroES-like domain/D-isomer specific 2-hydroxyacid dehydrogenase, NAD binding domain/Alanine dehydrogenase/PNT, C-terminal domain/NAD binding domain of 6-phosphogluconate dehydrogenase/Zinc-binding dehydrogenase, putative [Angomonas deanei]
MPSEVIGYAAQNPEDPLKPYQFTRRDVGPGDVSIKIAFCGVCHSDIHTARGEWWGTDYPIVLGHEIVGHVTAVGDKVTKYKVGDTVGVGCLVDSCLQCEQCEKQHEQFCDKHIDTYNGPCDDGTGKVTQGGYSDHIVVREEFVLRVPDGLDLAGAAPLLCAGITTYSPLRRWGVKKGTKVGVVGIGGLGHTAVKIAAAMGAEVTVFTTSQSKVEDAKRLGAHHVVISKDEAQMAAAAKTIEVMLDTVGCSHDLAPYLGAVTIEGVYIIVGSPKDPHPALHAFPLTTCGRVLAGSLIGGIQETQEMLDFCAEHKVLADVEVIAIDYINEAYERMLKSDVKYRFVIDLSTLKK